MQLDQAPRLVAMRCGGETLHIHRRWVATLECHGLTRVQDFLSIEGPIISGHPDRHVMRVSIGGQTFYLKREHRVPVRDRLSNWFAGFGPRSVSVREAMTLNALSRVGISAPEWIAAGEGTDGRAFLLLNDAGGADNLRDHLARRPIDRRMRRTLARRLA